MLQYGPHYFPCGKTSEQVPAFYAEDFVRNLHLEKELMDEERVRLAEIELEEALREDRFFHEAFYQACKKYGRNSKEANEAYQAIVHNQRPLTAKSQLMNVRKKKVTDKDRLAHRLHKWFGR